VAELSAPVDPLALMLATFTIAVPRGVGPATAAVAKRTPKTHQSPGRAGRLRCRGSRRVPLSQRVRPGSRRGIRLVRSSLCAASSGPPRAPQDGLGQLILASKKRTRTPPPATVPVAPPGL